MKVQEIRELIKLIDQSNISELTFESDGAKIKLRKPEAGAVVYSTATPEVKAVEAKPAAAKPRQRAAQAATDQLHVRCPQEFRRAHRHGPDHHPDRLSGSGPADDHRRDHVPHPALQQCLGAHPPAAPHL